MRVNKLLTGSLIVTTLVAGFRLKRDVDQRKAKAARVRDQELRLQDDVAALLVGIETYAGSIDYGYTEAEAVKHGQAMARNSYGGPRVYQA